jgi:hypothetical protein
LLLARQEVGKDARLAPLAGPLLLRFRRWLFRFVRLRRIEREGIEQQLLCRVVGKAFPPRTEQGALQQRVVGGQVLDRLLLFGDRLLVSHK